jgi:hypothetical protein
MGTGGGRETVVVVLGASVVVGAVVVVLGSPVVEGLIASLAEEQAVRSAAAMVRRARRDGTAAR